MRSKILTLLLVVSIPVSAVIGAGSIYFFNGIIQTSHKTTYSLEEEVSLLDQMIEMVDENEIERSEFIRVFKSQKENRIAAHNVMNLSQDISNNMITALIFIVIVQMGLLTLYLKKGNEK